MVIFVHFLCDCTKKTNQKKCAFAAARFLPKIGRFSLKRENLQHCIPFRVASGSSHSFTLETKQFPNGKNRKAACDFSTAPYFWKLQPNRSPRRGEILLTPDKTAQRCTQSGDVRWPRAPACGTRGRYGRTPQIMPRENGRNQIE